MGLPWVRCSSCGRRRQPRSRGLPSRWGLCMACLVGDFPDTIHPPGCFRSDHSPLPLTVLLTYPERCIECAFLPSSRVPPAPQMILQALFPRDAHLLLSAVPEVHCQLSQQAQPILPVPLFAQTSEQLVGQAVLHGPGTPLAAGAAWWKRNPIPAPAETGARRLQGRGDCPLLCVMIPAALFPIRHRLCFSYSYCCGCQKAAAAPLQVPALHSGALTFSLFHASAILVFSGLQIH